jgi:hypothetical protein
VSGYYQFHPTGSDVEFSVYAYYFGGGLLLGSGYVNIENAATSYTQFSFDVWLSDTPDSLLLQLELIGGDLANIGSYVLVDQLSLSGASAVEQISGLPANFNLSQNYPNPFNPSTTIEFSIPEESFVELKVFDVLGNEVALLANDSYPAGTYRTDFSNTNLTSGTYFYRLEAGNFVKIKKMLLLR